MDQQTYNIYCDESRVENKDSNKMTIGALVLLRSKKEKTVKELKNILVKHDFNYELKWSKVGDKYFDLYKELINYFLENHYLNFRCIVVDKNEVKFKKYHNGSLETAFYKFYYIMLKAKLLSNNEYYIFLDKKPTRDRNITRALNKFLEFHILKNKQNCRIKHFQSHDSDDNILLQLSDFFTGLVGFACNDIEMKSSDKYHVARYLMDKIGRKDFCESSLLKENKFNIFVWNGRK